MDAGPRDYRNEGPIRVDPPAEPQMAEAGIEGNGLPAFITAPVRIPTEAYDAAPQYPLRHFLPCSPAFRRRAMRPMAFIRVPAADAAVSRKRG